MASGQKVNLGKSSVFFSTNVIPPNREMICERLQIGEADERSKYLGLPNILGCNKSVILGYLKENVNKRVRSWDRKIISKSRKEILIKSVAQALPSFAMSVFLLPLEITKDFEIPLSKFWWSSTQDGTNKIHWIC